MSYKVSVVIPCYNVEKFVGKCIESVLGQTYKNFEIVCVNDGSQDNTLEVIQKYEAEFGDKVLVLTQKNEGQSSAINKGIRASGGEYLQFLDADDFLKKEKIEHQIRLIKKGDVEPDIIASAVEKRFEDGRIKIDKNIEYEPWEGLARYHIGITSSNLWKKKTVQLVEGFDENLSSNKEHDLIFRMLKNGATVLHDPEPLTVKRQRSSGSISSQNDHNHLGRKVIHRYKVYEYTKKNDLLSKELLNYLILENISDLKRIYDNDSLMALELHKKYIPDGFKLSSNLSRSYRLLYNLLGFKYTELLRSYLGK
ncbi:glycosyltransferase [Aliifodinibius salicampi]|uniref:Glycosyltransferase n=1 Tax=Fodinibius salicampi TaxID=1920655 RepID=A0ABT3PV26_9BACT|nr:glycosyltransferase [Fodinibius salicampi]MCW9711716.1 glycosyltransferase [Fodinibius salicampi]